MTQIDRTRFSYAMDLIRYIVNKLAQQTMRGSASAHWFVPLDSISYTDLDSELADDVEKLYVSAFPCGAPHSKDANYLMVELTVLKEMAQELAGLFGLMLPGNSPGTT